MHVWAAYSFISTWRNGYRTRCESLTLLCTDQDHRAPCVYTQKRVAQQIMEANNRAASSLIARLSDGLTASYMSNPDAVPLLTKVLEKGGMAHAKEIAWADGEECSTYWWGCDASLRRCSDRRLSCTHGEWGKAAGTAVARVCGQLCGRGRGSHRLGQPAGPHGVQSPNGRRAAAESTATAPAAAGSIERVSRALRVQ